MYWSVRCEFLLVQEVITTFNVQQNQVESYSNEEEISEHDFGQSATVISKNKSKYTTAGLVRVNLLIG